MVSASDIFFVFPDIQIVGGIWADKVGGKLVLGFGVIWWSIATVLTPIAARISLPCLLVMRAFMGIGEVGVALTKLCAINTIMHSHFDSDNANFFCDKHATLQVVSIGPIAMARLCRQCMRYISICISSSSGVFRFCLGHSVVLLSLI